MKKSILKKSLITICCAACAIASAAKLEIVSATYGAGDVQIDVKKKIIDSCVIGDIIAIDVSNAMVPKDPAHGKAKFLTLKYKVDGKEKSGVYREKTQVLIAPGIKPTKEFTMQKAVYGAKDKWIDVSKQIEAAIKDKKTIEVSNSTFKKDPIRGLGKYLVILYSKNNKLHLKKVPERGKFAGASM